MSQSGRALGARLPRLASMRFRQAALTATLVVALAVSTVPASGAAESKIEPRRTGQPSFAPPTGTTPIVGVQFHGIWSDRPPAVRQRILSQLAAAGVKYVRLDISWARLQPRGPFTLDLQYGVPETDRRIREIADHGMRTLLMLHWAPAWSSGSQGQEVGGVGRYRRTLPGGEGAEAGEEVPVVGGCARRGGQGHQDVAHLPAPPVILLISPGGTSWTCAFSSRFLTM